MTFTEHITNGVGYLTAPNIPARHAFTTRMGGVSEGIWSSLNLGENRGDAPENVIENYRRVKADTGIPTDHMAFTRQVHGKTVRVVAEADVHTLMTPVPYDADGLVTNIPGLAITCFIADCVPLLLHDPVHRVIGAIHCGWRSTVQDIMSEAVSQMKTLGTAACPPYHIAFVIGGTSAEMNLATVKKASVKYYDNLPTKGNELGHAFRDIELEKELLEASRKIGLGAQFGGKYFAHDIRVIRLPRHGASCPIGMGVSCSADRNVKAKINRDGLWIEKLDSNPGELIPDEMRREGEGDVVKIDLNRPMSEILAELTKYPVSTRLSLNGTIIVGRDIAHAKIKERLDRGEEMPQYLKDHPIYYAGPAKTPEGMPSGSFGPTTAGRMDSYVDQFQAAGGAMIMIAKGNRSKQVTDACHRHGGFYLGSIGGPAAVLAKNSIKKVELLEYPELGMEAIWKIEVEDFPAFILVDDKGNDFFVEIAEKCKNCALTK